MLVYLNHPSMGTVETKHSYLFCFLHYFCRISCSECQGRSARRWQHTQVSCIKLPEMIFATRILKDVKFRAGWKIFPTQEIFLLYFIGVTNLQRVPQVDSYPLCTAHADQVGSRNTATDEAKSRMQSNRSGRGGGLECTWEVCKACLAACLPKRSAPRALYAYISKRKNLKGFQNRKIQRIKTAYRFQSYNWFVFRTVQNCFNKFVFSNKKYSQ